MQQPKDLFYLQTELVESKVNMAVANAIDRVVNQISDLRKEMNDQFTGFKKEMNDQFSEFKKDITDQFSEFKKDMTDQFTEFKKDMRGEFSEFKKEMATQSVSADKRLIVVETKLGIVNEKEKQIHETVREVRSHVIKYIFRMLWALGGALASYLILRII